MVDFRLCKLSLQLVFVTLFGLLLLFFLAPCMSSLKKFAFAIHTSSILLTWPAREQLYLKQDGLYAGQAGSLEDFFI